MSTERLVVLDEWLVRLRVSPDVPEGDADKIRSLVGAALVVCVESIMISLQLTPSVELAVEGWGE